MRAFRTVLSALTLGVLVSHAACPAVDPYLQLPPAAQPPVRTRVQLIHFSDYHSHAVPYFSEHQAGQAGIARAVAYIKQVKAADPDLIVLNGGDMWNAGTPAFSDRYYKDCTEWKYLSGLTTAMAFGNHDVDYGWEAFASCVKQVSYPVLSGNLVDGSGSPILTAAGKPYVVKQIGSVRIGMFALAGPDFAKLVKPTNLPTGASFADGIAAARAIVKTLRETEKVGAVVCFGHQDRESDYAMATQVPGIDLILGTHSHYKGEFEKIPGTDTYFISPFQYLNYLSQVELIFLDGKLNALLGRLVRLSAELPEDAQVAQEVGKLQKDLEADPIYAPRFQVIGQAAVELDLSNIDRGESVLGNFAMDTVRTAASGGQAAFSTASSFRASIPPGPIRMEDYLTALPYKNKILSFTMTGAQVQALLDYGASKLGSDNFAVTSGLRYTIRAGKATNIGIAKSPSARIADYEPLDPMATYTVMTNDYMANIAAGYKDIFAKASASSDTMRIVNDEVIAYIKASSPVSAKLEGRITLGN